MTCRSHGYVFAFAYKLQTPRLQTRRKKSASSERNGLFNRKNEPRADDPARSEAFRKARERAALPVTEDGPVVFHSLRHTGISRLANHPAIPLWTDQCVRGPEGGSLVEIPLADAEGNPNLRPCKLCLAGGKSRSWGRLPDG